MMGDDFTDDLSYEDYVAEDYTGGTDSHVLDEEPSGGLDSYGKESLYSAEDSKELTDIDYNPYDDSKAFTESGDGTDAYLKQLLGQNDNDDEQDGGAQEDDRVSAMGGAMRMSRPAVETYTDDWDDDEEDNFDGDEDDNDEDDDDGKSKDSEDGQQSGDTQSGEQTEKTKKSDYNGVVKWKPGDAITIALLSQVWSKCRQIGKVRPYIDQANEAIKGVLNETGPNLMLRLNNWIDKMSDGAADTIGSLVNLVKNNGRRMALLSVAAFKSIFDQQHMETFLLATLPNILQAAISTNPVKAILNLILKISVPIINRAAKKA